MGFKVNVKYDGQVPFNNWCHRLQEVK